MFAVTSVLSGDYRFHRDTDCLKITFHSSLLCITKPLRDGSPAWKGRDWNKRILCNNKTKIEKESESSLTAAIAHKINLFSIYFSFSNIFLAQAISIQS